MEDGASYAPVWFEGRPWDPVRFHTPAPGETLRIGVLGDSGFGQAATYHLAGLMATYELDAVIHTGDLVYNIQDEGDPFAAYAVKWYLPLAPILHQGPVYPVVGNHDLDTAAFWEGLPFYYRAFPPLPGAGPASRRQWYAISFGDIQFVLLDTQVFFGEDGGPEQLSWLVDRLTDPAYRFTILVMHVPPYSNGLHPSDGSSVQSWVPLFEVNHVPLVLSGHDHNYQRLVVNGVTYVISGGGSAVLYDQTQTLPGSQVFARQTHFVLLEIADPHIRLTAVGVDGIVLDQVDVPFP
jgi:3',5'-cyclic AMP phosphodiesterase CpdA